MIDQLKNYNVNVQFLAELFNVTERTIQNYVALGLPKTERGEYPLLDCLLWLIKKQQDNIADLEKENPLTVSRKKAIDLNNEKKELELQKQRGNLLDAELVELSFATIMKMLIRNNKSIGPRLNKKLNGDATSLAIINAELDDFQNLCANTPLNYFEEELEQQLKQDGEK